MGENLPYVSGYGQIPNLFNAIKKASVPPKFNRDFMSTKLELKSSTYVAMIPLLKNLNFLDQGNFPTPNYKDYRDDTLSGSILASSVKAAYGPIFMANEYAYKLSREELTSKVKTITGLSEGSKSLEKIVGTFIELCKLSNFESGIPQKEKPKADTKKPDISEEIILPHKLGISYTINLNLPATTEIEVFNAIFKSLKEHILNEK